MLLSLQNRLHRSIAVSHGWVLTAMLLLTGCLEHNNTDKAPDNMQGCTAWSGGKSFGTALSDEALDVIIDPDGNLYLAGYENGTLGQTNIEPSGSARGIILKYDRLGTLINKTTLNSTGTSTVEALAFHPQTGGIYLVGRTNGALPGFNNNGQFDVVTGWFNPNQWQPYLFQLGNERPQHPRRLALGPRESLVVAGYDDTYVPTNYVAAWENPLLTTLTQNDTSLSPAWNYSYDSPHADTFSGLSLSSDGSIFVTGRSDGLYDSGISVYKYTSQGVLLWHSRLTNITYDNGAAIEVLPDGNLLVAGSTFAQLGAQQYGQMDIVIAKLEQSTGLLLWAVQYGSTGTDWVTDMTIDENGHIYVVGETHGVIEAGHTNEDQNAIFLVKFDATGNLKIARQWNSGALDVPTSIAVDACGRAFIAGYTTGNLIGPSRGSRDGFVFPVATQ